MNMTSLDDEFSIETPSFIVTHKKLNASSLPFSIGTVQNSWFSLPSYSNLTNQKSLTHDKNLTLQVCF
jgi:hypothetical protein